MEAHQGHNSGKSTLATCMNGKFQVKKASAPSTFRSRTWKEVAWIFCCSARQHNLLTFGQEINRETERQTHHLVFSAACPPARSSGRLSLVPRKQGRKHNVWSSDSSPQSRAVLRSAYDGVNSPLPGSSQGENKKNAVEKNNKKDKNKDDGENKHGR